MQKNIRQNSTPFHDKTLNKLELEGKLLNKMKRTRKRAAAHDPATSPWDPNPGDGEGEAGARSLRLPRRRTSCQGG